MTAEEIMIGSSDAGMQLVLSGPERCSGLGFGVSGLAV